MARTTVVELVDDIDGDPADETVSFGLDGAMYEIDLSKVNAAKLRAGLTPFLGHARKAGRARVSRNARAGSAGTIGSERAAEIRAWAAQHGIEVSSRGRIPSHVIEAFQAKDPSGAEPSAQQAVPQVTFRAVANP
jgi:hypothetical protein